IGAAKLALKRESRGVKKALAATERVRSAWAAEVDGRSDFVGRRIDDGDVVVQAIGNIQALAVGRDQYATRIVADGNPRQYIFGGSGEIIDERLAVGSDGLEQARYVNRCN